MTKVIRFTAEWCGPCKAYAPVFNNVAATTPGIVFETIDIEILPTHLAYDICREEGSFHANLRKIFISEDVVKRGGATLINILIHELLHVCYWYNNLSNNSTEEDIVNAMSNYITELLFQSKLTTLIEQEKNKCL